MLRVRHINHTYFLQDHPRQPLAETIGIFGIIFVL